MPLVTHPETCFLKSLPDLPHRDICHTGLGHILGFKDSGYTQHFEGRRSWVSHIVGISCPPSHEGGSFQPHSSGKNRPLPGRRGYKKGGVLH